MKSFCILASLLLTLTMAKAQETEVFKKETFNATNGLALPYRIAYPEGFDKSKKYPLVVILHGAGERGADNTAQLKHGSALFLDPANREQFPALVVFPQCPTGQWWASLKLNTDAVPKNYIFDYSRPETQPMAAVAELIQQLKSQGSVDASRVYVAGLSMGGMGTFEITWRHPELFAAAMPICGGGDAMSYDSRVKDVPFWIFHGDSDPVVDVKLSRDMNKRLKEIGASVKYTEYPGVDHFSWVPAFAEKEFLSWMFAQKKK